MMMMVVVMLLLLMVSIAKSSMPRIGGAMLVVAVTELRVMDEPPSIVIPSTYAWTHTRISPQYLAVVAF